MLVLFTCRNIVSERRASCVLKIIKEGQHNSSVLQTVYQASSLNNGRLLVHHNYPKEEASYRGG